MTLLTEVPTQLPSVEKENGMMKRKLILVKNPDFQIEEGGNIGLVL